MVGVVIVQVEQVERLVLLDPTPVAFLEKLHGRMEELRLSDHVHEHFLQPAQLRPVAHQMKADMLDAAQGDVYSIDAVENFTGQLQVLQRRLLVMDHLRKMQLLQVLNFLHNRVKTP